MKTLLVILFVLFNFFLFAQPDSLYVTTSDSVRLFVKRSGHGFPVLFVHGGPGSNSYYFEKEGGDVFSRDVLMIYLDQRGCGRSDSAQNNDYSLQRIVKDFEEVREKLGYDKWIIMAHSFGGILATEYAYQYAAGIRAMVYLNCTVNLKNSAKSGIQKAVEFLQLKGEEKEHFMRDTANLIALWGEVFSKLREKGVMYKLMFDKPESKALDDSLMSLPFLKFIFSQKIWNYPEYLEDYSAKTSAIKMPVLVIGGTRDYTIGVDHVNMMHFPDMQIKYVEGGHALYLEHNAELYKAVSPFLQKYSSGK